MVGLTLNRRHVAVLAAAFIALLALSATALGVALTGRADANHKFNDIATGTFFHQPTAWLADNNIADGYPDGTFKPNNNITRGQASYWLANYNNSITRHEASSNPAAGTTFAQNVFCPTGKRPLGGGAGTFSSSLVLNESKPLVNGWATYWITDDNTVVDPASITAYVICAPGLF